MKTSAREIALSIITQVEESGAYAEYLIDRCLKENSSMDDRDRRLVTEITYGTLRMKGLCDFILKKHVRNWGQLDVVAKNILRLSIYQFLFTDRIPPFAIVSEAVNLAKTKAPEKTGLINAVLRKILAKQRQELLPPADTHDLSLISALYSHPLWLIKRWINCWGWEDALKLCAAQNALPPITLRVNTLKITRDEAKAYLTKEGFSVSLTPFSPDGLIILSPSGQLRNARAFQEGLVLYQDEASQLISYLVSPTAGERILDLCAGTGGKTFHLAALMKNNGKILAIDRDEAKLQQLVKEALKFGISMVEVKSLDATHHPPQTLIGSFDRVLVDAPCSGTGILRRAPEIKWRLKDRDLLHLAQTQSRLLEFAAQCLRKGGVLVYSTCSLMEEENEKVVFSFLERHADFHLSFPQEPVATKFVDSKGIFKTLPHRDGTDGFFGVVMIKD
ncbi:MAG: 16S rRNA (cytosine(967)-C(5))-methyltransferase RsmB [Syntrophales bacterium]|nr:16S rRNA (cytosine(967)-C(5))-methyltransferase RsmB [Syntrophales bacterium]